MDVELEQETEQQAEIASPIQAVLNRMNERDSQESPVVEDADEAVEATVEETPQPEADKAKVEGPSVAMKTLAKQHGLDDDAISLMQNDEQLRVLIEKTASRDTKEPDPIPEPEFNLEWPEGEFDADDPVRKNITALHDHYAKKLDEAYGYMNKLAEVALESKQQLEQFSQTRQVADEIEFDDFVDSLDIPALGNRAKGELPGLAQQFRSAMYFHFKDEEAKDPRANRRSLLEKVAKEAGFSTKASAKEAAIQAANSQRLGTKSTGARPIPPKELTGIELFKARLAEINARPHNKEQ